MSNRWNSVTIDCQDPDRAAQFWSALLGRNRGPSQDGWVYLGDRTDGLPRLVFQPVPEPKGGKTRIHLDVAVDDVKVAEQRVIALGGAATGQVQQHPEGVVVVMLDPEQNEFCLVQYF